MPRAHNPITPSMKCPELHFLRGNNVPENFKLLHSFAIVAIVDQNSMIELVHVILMDTGVTRDISRPTKSIHDIV